MNEQYIEMMIDEMTEEEYWLEQAWIEEIEARNKELEPAW